jgi:hypothetical protein
VWVRLHVGTTKLDNLIGNNMLTREEFERAIKTFLVELNHRCLNETVARLRQLPALVSELDQYVADLKDPTQDEAQVLYHDFAYIDEYIGADWPGVADQCYEAYRKAASEVPP